MSVESFKDLIYTGWAEEKRNTEKLIQELIQDLPNRETDDPDTCLYWPSEKNWSRAIKNTLEEAGYYVTYLSDSEEYYIEFDDDVKEEIKEEMYEEAKLYREMKRQRK